MSSLIVRLVKNSIGMFLAIWVLFEDSFWSICEAITRRIKSWKLISLIEKKIMSLGVVMSCLVFLIPMVILIPFKLTGMWLMANGYYAYGLSVFIFAKIIGTMIGARLFELVKPKLMTIEKFKVSFEWLIDKKAKVIDFAKTSRIYRVVNYLRKRVRQKIKILIATWH